MPLHVGARLGPYEILSPLGAGGMGEVYRATDTNLKRQVAIKVLPQAMAGDLERLARFQREAEVLAALNHPNIAHIHGLEKTDGTLALVMELVEGPTLADRIAQGPVPLNEVLPIARQIAEALEAAHEQGIIHRDLKPANIKVRDDGTVKVLDFGLAKLVDPATSPSGNASISPTLSMQATMAGVILGTAAYMSPEQAKGRQVDKRTDIFAFGCVLYEMLTGRAAFEGEDVTDILSAVVRMEPDWLRLPSQTPTSIQRLLRRALKKEPHQRLGDIRDARIEIEEASAEKEQPLVSTPARSSRRALVALAVAAIIIVALAIPTVRYLRETSAPELRTDIVTPVTSDPISLAISPDGRRLAFVASGEGQLRLWLRQLDRVSAQPLAGTEGAKYPFWSPDSRSLGFFAGGKLKRIDIDGGPPHTLADATPGFGGAWSSDGVILFGSGTIGNSALSRVLASGGEVVPATRLARPNQSGHRFPQFLSGSRQFLFYSTGTEEARGIYLGSLDSLNSKRLTPADSAGAFMPPRWLLMMRQGTFVAQGFDLARGVLEDDFVTVADSVSFDGYDNVGAFSVSAAGLVAYRSGGLARSQLIWFDRMGKMLGTFGAIDENALQSPQLSPDGRLVAVRRTVQNNADIYLLDAVGLTRFTFVASGEQYAVWSPDGRWIAFGSNRKGPYHLFRKPSGGAGSDELLLESPQSKNVDDWSPDGRFLLYNSEDPASGRDLWVLPLDKDGKPGKAVEFLKTNFQEHRGQFSPDGRMVAYVSDQSGQPDIWVRPFPGPGGEWQVSSSGGVQPRWRHDGKELYYLAPDGKLVAVPVTIEGAVFKRGTPVPLFQTRIVGGGTNAYARPQYDVAVDGRFLINTAVDDVSAPITLVQNWNSAVKK